MERKVPNVKLTSYFVTILAIIMLCGLVMFSVQPNAQATDNDFLNETDFSKIQEDKPSSLKITYTDSEKAHPLQNLNVRIYKIASMQNGLPSVEKYKEILKSVGWENFVSPQIHHAHTVSQWEQMARTISDLIQAQNHTPESQLTSNNQGTVTFNDLPTGIYLVVTDSFITQDNTIRYTFQPILLSLPQVIKQDNNLSYNVEITSKHTKEPIGKTIEYKLIKHWDDARNTTLRPKSITVDILQDGKIHKTVVLKESNQWSYSWKTVENRHQWSVAERSVGRYYTVANNKRATTFIITNSLKPEIPKKFGNTGINGYFIVLLPLFLLTGMIILLVAKKRKAKDQK